MAVHKIRSIIIDAYYFEHWQRFVAGIGEGQPAPLLERLILTVKDHAKHFRTYRTLSTAFTPSPKFVELQLPAFPRPNKRPPMLATATCLTFDTLECVHYAARGMLPLIQAVTHLKHFKAKSFERSEWPGADFSKIISLPLLRSADVTVPGNGQELLTNFFAPRLTRVRLDGYREDVSPELWERWEWDATEIFLRPFTSRLLNHLSTHSPLIRQLELTYIHLQFQKEDHVRLLCGLLFPLLEELILVMTNIRDAALVESAGRNPILKMLQLRRCKFITVDGLRSFVQGGVHPEFVMIVNECPNISQEDIKSLSEIGRVQSN